MNTPNDLRVDFTHFSKLLLLASMAVFAFSGLTSEVRAAAYTFSGTNGNFDYTSGASWSPGAPVGGFTNSLIFGNGASLAAGSNVTVSNNLGFVRFNSITVNYAGPGSGTAPTFSLVGQGVNLSSSNGSNPFILISNTGTVRPDTTISQWMTFDANTTITTVSDLTMSGRFYTNANQATVTKSGGGTLRITGDNKTNGYTGNWTVSGGTLQIGNAGSGNLGSGTITLTNNAIYVQRTTGNESVDNVISGTTSQFVTFHLGGNNVVTLNKQSDYTSGFTYLQAQLGAGTGEVRLGTNNAMSGNTVVEMQNAVGYTLTLNLNNYNQTLKHLQSTAGATAANTKVSLGSGTLTVGDASSRTFGGEISGSGGVVKTGSGSWTLTAANTYSGGTVVTAGSLILGANGSIGNSSVLDVASSATLNVSAVSGGFVVGSSQTLKGSGTVVGNTTIDGSLQPGNSPGLLSFNNDLTLGTTAAVTMEINGAGTRGTAFDAVNVGGLLTYDGALTLSIGTTFAAGSYSFDLFDFGSQTGTFDSVALGGSYIGSLNDNGLGVWGLTSGTETWTFTQSSGLLALEVVPEPSTYALVLLAATGLGVRLFLRKRAN